MQGTIASLALGFALLAAPLAAQVEPVVELHHGTGVTLVRNTSKGPLLVSLQLHFGHVEGRQVVLDSAVDALVSPSGFTLAPNSQQVVRVKLRQAVPLGTVLRFAVQFDEPEAPQQNTAKVVALLHFRTVLITKVVVR